MKTPLPRLHPEEPFLTPEEASGAFHVESKTVTLDEIARVFPFQTRPLDRAHVQELKRSIRLVGGLLQPLVVTRMRVTDPRFGEEGYYYVVLDGRHRLEALSELAEEDAEAGVRWLEAPVIDVWAESENLEYLVRAVALMSNTLHEGIRLRQALLGLLVHLAGLFESPLEDFLAWLDYLEKHLRELKQELPREEFGKLLALVAQVAPDAREGADANQLKGLLENEGVTIPDELAFAFWVVADPAARALAQFLKPFALSLEEFLARTREVRRWPVELIREVAGKASEAELAVIAELVKAKVATPTILVAFQQRERLRVLKALLPDKPPPTVEPSRLANLPPKAARREAPKVLRALSRQLKALPRDAWERPETRRALEALDQAVDVLATLLKEKETSSPAEESAAPAPQGPEPAVAMASEERIAVRREALRRHLGSDLTVLDLPD